MKAILIILLAVCFNTLSAQVYTVEQLGDKYILTESKESPDGSSSVIKLAPKTVEEMTAFVDGKISSLNQKSRQLTQEFTKVNQYLLEFNAIKLSNNLIIENQTTND